MRTADFDYHLPESSIAQTAARRHSHQRRERLVLFPDHDFDFGLGDFDDCVEYHCEINQKVNSLELMRSEGYHDL